MSNMSPLDYLALIYVNKNFKDGQPASELAKMFHEAKTEIKETAKEISGDEKTKVHARIIK